MNYSEQLARELSSAGMRGALPRRIIAEIEDHLACDPGADLGAPAVLARRFADELATRRARRAAFGAFVALTVAGTLLAAAMVAVRSAGYLALGIGHGTPALGTIGFVVSATAAQVALASGALGCLRALRCRSARVVSRPQALVLVRRGSVALASGFVAMAGLATMAVGLQGGVPRWWTALALALAGAGALALAGAVPVVMAARRLQPRLQGSAGDLGDDLRGLVPQRLHPGGRRFAVLLAATIVFVGTIAGIVQDDPFDGILRGLLDALACLSCYAALGGYLGLRREPMQS